jgi:hypothetical protein
MYISIIKLNKHLITSVKLGAKQLFFLNITMSLNNFEPNNNYFNIRKIQESYLLSSKAVICLELFNGKVRYSIEGADG